MATTTNYGWTTPDDTALVKDGAAAIRTLGSSVDTTTKALNPSTTLGDIEYRSSTANTNTRLPIGTSGQFLSVVGGVPAWATATDQTPLTTKGDLFTFSTVDARLGIGANNTILTADSAEPTGLKWAAPAASGGMTLISETVANAATGISFTSLGSYKQLLLMWTGISHSANGSTFGLRFNANSGTVYYSIGFQSVGTSYNTSESALAQIGGYQTAQTYTFGESVTAGLTAAAAGSILIDNYTSSTKYKNCTVQFSYYDNNNTRYASQNSMMSFTDTTAITSLDITRLSGSATISNVANSTIRLYGIS